MSCTHSGPLLAATVLLAAMCAAPAQGGFWYDVWGVSAQGSMDLVDGYSNGGGNSGRFSKGYQHMTFMGFSGLSDGADGIPPGGSGDHGDGVLLSDWMTGKRAFNAVLYFRDFTGATCDPAAAFGTYLNSPVTVLGFRCGNGGPFLDHETYPNGAGTWDNPKVGYGDMAPVAWRMGHRPYTQKGDMGTGGEYWKVSWLDSRHPGADVRIGDSWFGTTGYGGFSTNAPGLPGSGRFAFDWLVEKSDAHMVNSSTISEADCSGPAGQLEPRDAAHDLDFGEGWYAKKLDRCMVYGMAFDPEMKGLVFSSATVPTVLNNWIWGYKLYSGAYGPYLAVYATYSSDLNNDGCVDVVDLLILAECFGLHVPEVGDCGDLNCDGSVDVIDLLNLVAEFGSCLDP